MTSEPPQPPQQSSHEPSYFVMTLLEIDNERARLTTMAGEEVEVIFESSPTIWVAKDLGRWARRNMGMKARTEPGEFTRIIWKDQVLGINQPLAMLLEKGKYGREWALGHCTFCLNPLRSSHGGVGPYPEPIRPFPHCYFCEDTPAWHHGWCCPQNATSCMYRGPTHADRTRVFRGRSNQSGINDQTGR